MEADGGRAGVHAPSEGVVIAVYTMPPPLRLLTARPEMPRIGSVLRIHGQSWRVVDIDAARQRALVEAA